MAEENETIHRSTEQARAGATPHMTRYILVFSLLLVVAVFAVLVLVRV